MALTANETIEQNLWSYITDDATMAALIGDRLYPIVAPDNTPRHAGNGDVLPYGTYRRISGPRESHHDGPAGLAHPRFQFDWIGGQQKFGIVSYATALEIAMEARKLLDGFQGTLLSIHAHIILDDDRDIYAPGLELTGISQDYIVWHREATT